MEAKKFDNIFRKKLTNHTVTVSEEAWSQLDLMLDEGQVKKKNPYYWYSAAAMLVLLVVAGVRYSTVNREKFEVSYVVPRVLKQEIAKPSLNLNIQEVDFVVKKQQLNPYSIIAKSNSTTLLTEKQEEEDQMMEKMPIEESTNDMGLIEEYIAQENTIEELEEEQLLPIKITYIKANQKETGDLVAKSKTVLPNDDIDKVIKFTKEKPAEVWASIKHKVGRTIGSTKELGILKNRNSNNN
ncbi:hypothetical protein [Reichenbachiella versicolor]|uniref:hypothetical protein n=1 Tax=Reichenbachiella versicolor TaxID=1821036 RepID=UPI000D6E2ABB|nr:hypothetical protein [Reichenbachiella versicolor]